jgi:hypothetical protein
MFLLHVSTPIQAHHQGGIDKCTQVQKILNQQKHNFDRICCTYMPLYIPS